ncbi:hypothetical protein [Thalassovita sp.]|nr:hypothetical protein [Thalassovita sp.]MDF1801447.1 hypothetical protein [Thalassovita sp.]
MIRQITDIMTRAEDTLFSDALGVAALIVMTVAALHLPNWI